MSKDAFLSRARGWWLQPIAPQRLAAFRVACCAYALWYLYPRWDKFHDIFRTDPGLFDPVGLARLLPGPIAPEIMDAVYWVTIAAGVLMTIGLKARLAGPVFGVALLFMLCYRNSWSMILHMHNALVVHALILGFVRCSDAWSVDAWLRRRRSPDAPPPGPSWRYGWPIMLICGVTVGAYVLAGVAKLAGDEGLHWASGQSLRAHVAVNAIRYEVLVGESAPSFYWIYENIWIFWVLGIMTYVLELLAPAALVNRRLALAWAVMTWGMHWGIYFIMGIKFRYQQSGAIFVSFLETEKLPGGIRRLASRMGLDKLGAPPPAPGGRDDSG